VASTPSVAVTADATPAPRVTLVLGRGCHLCEAALEVVKEVCGSAYDVRTIDGDPALEARYRERIPVVEIDGVAAFTYHVHPDALADRLAR
jgi:hypothetical protein